MTKKVGYARVSTEGQSLGRQLAALHQAGCDPILQDKASGKSVRGRPGLDKAIKALRPGDVLVLAEWDRATRSMLDGIAIMERVHERGATIKALDRQFLDLSTTIGKGILAFLSALAQDERERILKRSKDGLKHAKARGIHCGRPPALNDYQREEAARRLAAGESARSVARLLGVSHVTVTKLRVA
jgi:DNA invertase Pin-like site-specific DNA recombinase